MKQQPHVLSSESVKDLSHILVKVIFSKTLNKSVILTPKHVTRGLPKDNTFTQYFWSRVCTVSNLTAPPSPLLALGFCQTKHSILQG